MKASEFAGFFNFTISREEGFIKDGPMYRFAVTDNEGTLATRYIFEVSELVDQFDICLHDFVDATLLDFGFYPDDNSNLGFYGQALDFINNGIGSDLKGTDTYKIIECLCDSSKIEDDVTGDNSENVKGFVYDYFADALKYAQEAVDCLCFKECRSLKEIIELVVDAADTDSIGEKESVEELYATLYQQLSPVCLEDFLSGWHELIFQAEMYGEIRHGNKR